MNKKAIFDFTIEQRSQYMKTKDDVYRIAWETARAIIQVSGLWDEYKDYVMNGV